MANRLKGVLNDLISDLQCGGLPGCQLHEGVLIANELIERRIKLKKQGIVCKIDFKKAYDMVSWDFMYKFFNKMDFGVK